MSVTANSETSLSHLFPENMQNTANTQHKHDRIHTTILAHGETINMEALMTNSIQVQEE